MRLRKCLLARHMLIDGGMVGERRGVALVIGVGLGLGFAADDVADRVDLHRAAKPLGPRADVGDVFWGVGQLGKGCEQAVAMLRCEIAAGRTEGGVHGHWAWRLQAGRAADDALQVVILAPKIERLGRRIGPLDNRQPFARLIVASLRQCDAEHCKLLRVPAADDVEPGTALTDVIDCRQRLGRIERMHQRHMHGHEQGDIACDAGKACRPGEGLERPLAHMVLAAKTLPAGDRQEKFEARFVSDCGRSQIVIPACPPTLGHICDGEPAIGIG